MDAVLDQINAGCVNSAMVRLQALLYDRRCRLSTEDWRRYVADHVLIHRLREVIHTDPFTYRAFAKPRGYAGDAVMMDYIYGYYDNNVALCETGRRIFEFATKTAAPQAVRFRRGVLAEIIDATARRADRPIDVVAVAAGHLREMDLAEAPRRGAARVLAMDQDEESLELVKRDYARLGVDTRAASVRHILAGRIPVPPADLAYTAGLYDYLPDAAATRLTSIMFDSLRPGGTLLVVNFLPNILDVGYMESLMDWHLIYRTDDDMRRLTTDISTCDVARVEQFHDPFDNITFLQVTKRG
jgi:extracellular factor (EF) 3-hydroxypalmitic acid methyl ester biosynthesis protein